MKDECCREMDAQAVRNGWTPNPNHSDARYMEHPAAELKAAAFRSKEGYSGHKGAAVTKDPMMGSRSKI